MKDTGVQVDISTSVVSASGESCTTLFQSVPQVIVSLGLITSAKQSLIGKVKGNGSEANRGDVEVDCHYLEEDEGTSRRLEVMLEKGSCWLRSCSGSSESPPERENVKGWSLRVEDECSGGIYL